MGTHTHTRARKKDEEETSFAAASLVIGGASPGSRIGRDGGGPALLRVAGVVARAPGPGGPGGAAGGAAPHSPGSRGVGHAPAVGAAAATAASSTVAVVGGQDAYERMECVMINTGVSS